MTAANIAMFIIFGLLMAGAVNAGGALGWGSFVVLLAIWFWAETVAGRALLKIIGVDDPAVPK